MSSPPPDKKFCSSSSPSHVTTASIGTNGSTDAPQQHVLKIAVEGNIATGKSTFLQILSDSYEGYRVIGEPLTKWTNTMSTEDEEVSFSQKCGGNLLGLFYDSPRRWAYTFQAYACLSRLKAQLKSPPADFPPNIKDPVLFYERSVHSDKFCFAQNCHESGLLDDTEWTVYCDWHSFMLEYLPLQFDGFIYLKSDPEVSLKRLHIRSRPEEKDVDLDYLTSLHQKHESWLVDRTVNPPSSFQKDVPILVLDCNEEFENNPERKKTMLHDVQQFLKRLEL